MELDRYLESRLQLHFLQEGLVARVGAQVIVNRGEAEMEKKGVPTVIAFIEPMNRK
jgi:hypothetical protein